jgi:hypothetical protein
MFPSFDSKPLGLPVNALDAATNTKAKTATTKSAAPDAQNRRLLPRLNLQSLRISSCPPDSFRAGTRS